MPHSTARRSATFPHRILMKSLFLGGAPPSPAVRPKDNRARPGSVDLTLHETMPAMTDLHMTSDDTPTDTHSGFVAIVGKPNVGKSTLLNAFLNTKVAPTSPRPQTTRRGVRGIHTTDTHQIVCVDTPGVHKPKDALGKYMNHEVHAALADVDAIIWVVDLRHPPTDEDSLVAHQVREL